MKICDPVPMTREKDPKGRNEIKYISSYIRLQDTNTFLVIHLLDNKYDMYMKKTDKYL